MRRINWEDVELTNFAISCLTAAWNVRYNTIHCLANLVSGLALYHVRILFILFSKAILVTKLAIRKK